MPITHYGEMVLGFMEIATYMNKVDRTIPDRVFRTFVTPMIRVELSYNVKLIESLVCKAVLSTLTQELIHGNINEMKAHRT